MSRLVDESAGVNSLTYSPDNNCFGHAFATTEVVNYSNERLFGTSIVYDGLVVTTEVKT